VNQAITAPLLSVRNLKVEFRTGEGVVKAVNGVSFDVNRGEIVAIVGESGYGKSVTALALLRLIPEPPRRIVAGEVMFDHRGLAAVDVDAIRDIRGNRIAMIFQEPMTSLNPVHTISRQVGEPLALHKGLGRATTLAKTAALLQSVNIPEPSSRAGNYPHQFSGGMRQRATIAMAMGCVPSLIVADEPTTALDVTIQAQLLELLQREVARHSTALLLAL
jgi:ABC-type dipeptide/oligopeptide/nickel transport system ATPase component